MTTPASKPLLYAHRGAAVEQPENTVPSFARAIELGANALEMDAHMTSDGHVVVSHDPTGLRMAGVKAEIRRTPIAELQSWDAGHGFVDQAGERSMAGQGYAIPTLEQIITEFPDIPINVDLKQSWPPMVTEAVALIRRLDAESRVTLASFQLTTLLRVRAEGYTGPMALSRTEVLALMATPGALLKRLHVLGDAAQLPYRLGPVNVASKRIIDKCHKLGMRVDFWTVNDPDEAERLLDMGADGIMTDDPAAIAPVFERRGLR